MNPTPDRQHSRGGEALSRLVHHNAERRVLTRSRPQLARQRRRQFALLLSRHAVCAESVRVSPERRPRCQIRQRPRVNADPRQACRVVLPANALRVRCAYRFVSAGCVSLQFVSTTSVAICSVFQCRAVRFSSSTRTLNPQVAGSNPARPMRKAPANDQLLGGDGWWKTARGQHRVVDPSQARPRTPGPGRPDPSDAGTFSIPRSRGDVPRAIEPLAVAEAFRYGRARRVTNLRRRRP